VRSCKGEANHEDLAQWRSKRTERQANGCPVRSSPTGRYQVHRNRNGAQQKPAATASKATATAEAGATEPAGRQR